MSRPSDIAVLDFYRRDKHMLMDAIVTTVYKNMCIGSTTTILLGLAAKQAGRGHKVLCGSILAIRRPILITPWGKPL